MDMNYNDEPFRALPKKQPFSSPGCTRSLDEMMFRMIFRVAQESAWRSSADLAVTFISYRIALQIKLCGQQHAAHDDPKPD